MNFAISPVRRGAQEPAGLGFEPSPRPLGLGGPEGLEQVASHLVATHVGLASPDLRCHRAGRRELAAEPFDLAVAGGRAHSCLHLAFETRVVILLGLCLLRPAG